MSDKKTFELEITNSNLPAIWENGGGWSNTGSVRVITDRKGCPKTALCLRHRCNDNHALFVLHQDDVIIEASRHRDEYTVKLWKVETISVADGKAAASAYLLCSLEKGCWDTAPHDSFFDAIKAALDKTCTYHARNAVWYKERKNKAGL